MRRRKDSIIALSFPIFHSVIPGFYSVIPDFYSVIPAKAGIQRVGNGVRAPPIPLNFGILLFPRHSRESGNPQTNNVILAEAGTSQPLEIKNESRATNPFSRDGLAELGFDFRRFSGC